MYFSTLGKEERKFRKSAKYQKAGKKKKKNARLLQRRTRFSGTPEKCKVD